MGDVFRRECACNIVRLNVGRKSSNEIEAVNVALSARLE